MISLATSSLLDRIGASRSGASLPVDGWKARTVRPHLVADPSTRVTFSNSDASGTVYSDPRAASGATRLWSSPIDKDDTVSAVMARNQTNVKSSDLGDQWRGLGGALLTRFGKTGEDEAQTVVDESSAPLDATSVDVVATQKAELAGVTTGASTAGVTIRTRSGQSVELKIAVNAQAGGMKVELKASGAMSADDRAAIGQLADGLDRALEGLGKGDAVGLDLSGLMSYDHRALASVDLTARNGAAGGALGTFSLHLGDDKAAIALQGSAGELHLSVDMSASLGTAPAQQRSDALQSMLDRMDSAGDRSHATAALVQQMKSAFEQMQAAAASDGSGDDATNGEPDAPDATATPAVSATDATTPAQAAGAASTDAVPPGAARDSVNADVASALSGLADFDASFGGKTQRTNRYGDVVEAGRADYRLSQTTATKNAADGSQTAAQTVSEQLTAVFFKAPGAAKLDRDSGTYAETRIDDSSNVTTLVESTPHRALHVSQRIDEQKNKTVTDFENHREVRRQSWPSARGLSEWLR